MYETLQELTDFKKLRLEMKLENSKKFGNIFNKNFSVVIERCFYLIESLESHK